MHLRCDERCLYLYKVSTQLLLKHNSHTRAILVSYYDLISCWVLHADVVTKVPTSTLQGQTQRCQAGYGSLLLERKYLALNCIYKTLRAVHREYLLQHWVHQTTEAVASHECRVHTNGTSELALVF
jgi:hypothetical protein